MHRLVLAPPTVVLLVAPFLVAFYRHHLAGERALVAQVAALEASWLETWFDERRASAGLSGTSFPQAEPYLAATLEGSTGDAVRVRSYRGGQGVTHVDFVLVRLLDEAVHVFRRDGADGEGVVTEAIVHAERQDGVTRIDRGEVLGGIVPLLGATVVAAVVVYAASMTALGRVCRKQRAAVALGAQRAEAERERARRLLSAVAEASPDAIYTKDLQGRYTLVNRAAAAFLGHPAAEVLGRTDRELFPVADADLIEANDRVASDEARVVTLEEPVVTAAGQRVFLATKGPLVDGQGRVVGTFGISRDITERRAAEQAVVEQAATLRMALADLERFNRVLVDRELAMVGLKRRLNAYAARLGEAPPFAGASLEADGGEDA